MGRETELLALALAHAHVQRARTGIARQQHWVELHAHGDADQLLQGQRELHAKRETLGELLLHRDEIVKRLDGR